MADNYRVDPNTLQEMERDEIEFDLEAKARAAQSQSELIAALKDLSEVSINTSPEVERIDIDIDTVIRDIEIGGPGFGELNPVGQGPVFVEGPNGELVEREFLDTVRNNGEKMTTPEAWMDAREDFLEQIRENDDVIREFPNGAKPLILDNVKQDIEGTLIAAEAAGLVRENGPVTKDFPNGVKPLILDDVKQDTLGTVAAAEAAGLVRGEHVVSELNPMGVEQVAAIRDAMASMQIKATNHDGETLTASQSQNPEKIAQSYEASQNPEGRQ